MMDNSTRVLVNTLVQYVKTIINVVISLFSTRIILRAIGVDDYGIYVLVGGVVSLLSFIVNAMVTTTQRYISFYSVQSDKTEIKRFLNTSVILHIAIGFFAYIGMELIGLLLFDGLLNIPAERVAAAYKVFHITCFMVVLSFVSAPYRALLISHENIAYISLVDIVDAFFKLLIAFIVYYSNGDRLILYTFLMCLISFFNFVAFFVYDLSNYEECSVPSWNNFSKEHVRRLTSFAGWTIYSVGCIVGRTQGLTIILNKFFGVVINAAYGIAMQINGALMFVSQSLLNAMNPQIVKAEGMGNRTKMLRLSEMESKFSFLLMAMVAIPCIFEMESILELWLKEVPPCSVLFCRFILLASVVDQLTIGLGTANQAIGNIRNYSLVVNTIKLLTLIPVFFVSYMGHIEIVMPIYVAFEFICAIVRLFFLKQTAGLSIRGFCRRVFMKEIIPILLGIGTSLTMVSVFDFKGRFMITIMLTCIIYICSIFLFGLCSDEKAIVNRILNSITNKLYRNEDVSKKRS